MRRAWWVGAGMAGAMMLAGAPALADVKSGVDAWQKGDFKRAVDEWRPLAIAGDADAQFNMGQAYKLGRGVPLDPALAQSWFLKAANQGHLEAGDNYGLALFEDGKKAEAAPWLEKSAARFERRAQLVLGTMLFNGDGVTRDYPRAYALMTRASQQGLKSASETLAQMDQYISSSDRQQGVALAQRYAAEQQAFELAKTGGGRTVIAGNDASPPPPTATMRPQPVARVPAPSLPVAHAPTSAHRPTPVAAEPTPHAGAGGGWRIQLGAFRDENNAHGLWSSVAGRLPGAHPIYLKTGAITRLLAGSYAGKAEAQRACAAVHQTCVVLAP